MDGSENSVGLFIKLPTELILTICYYLEVKDILSLSEVSKSWYRFANDQSVWKKLCDGKFSSRFFKNVICWKTLFINLNSWKWSLEHRSPSITLGESQKEIIRRRGDKSCTNPAARAGHPLHTINPTFEVIVKSTGNWGAIGLATEDFPLDNNNVVGSWSKSFNLGYYFDVTQHRIKYKNIVIISQDHVAPVRLGDTLGITLDFETNTVTFTHNGKVQGSPFPLEEELKNFPVYPVASLGPGCAFEFKKSAGYNALQPTLQS